MRSTIRRLIELGPLPDESAEVATEELINEYDQLLNSIERPLTDAEAGALCRLFGNDNFYGLAWTLLHLVETAPSWPIGSCLEFPTNRWIVTLRERARRANHVL
jgi:hypothetical protein